MEAAMYIFLGLSCAALILLVLIQQGKGAGVGFSMGGASQAMFGGSGGRDFFIKLTAGIALCFLAACMILGKMSASGQGQYQGAMKDATVPAAPAPVLPATAAPVEPAAAAKPVIPAPKPIAPAPVAQPKK
jgi:preprotein translocase subunit SecG